MCRYKIYNNQRIKSIIFQSNLKDDIIDNKDSIINALKATIKEANNKVSNLEHKINVIEHSYDEQARLLIDKERQILDLKVTINKLGEASDQLNKSFISMESNYNIACDANHELQTKLAKFHRVRDSKGHFMKTKKK